MEGVDGLYEITGHVLPCDSYRHLASKTYTFDEFRITFSEEGGFTCVPETEEFCEETAIKIEAYVESFAIASDELVTVIVDARRYRGPHRTTVHATAAISIEARATVRAVVTHPDGSVSPNPSETAWLASALIQDPNVAAVAVILGEARAATRKRTRDDYIAFEMMERAAGDRRALARATRLTKRQVSDLGLRLQIERHRSGFVPTPVNFNPNQLHRDVHDLFIRWAKSRL